MTWARRGSRYDNRFQELAGGDWHPGENYFKPHIYDMMVLSRQPPVNWDWWNHRPAELVDLTGSFGMWMLHPEYAKRNNDIVSYLSDLIQKLDLAVDVIEAKSLVDLVNLQLKRVLKVTRSLKRLPRTLKKFRGRKAASVVYKPKSIRGKGPRKNLKKPSKDEIDLSKVPAVWLEYNFAVRPLMGTIGDLTTVFDQPFDFLDFRKYFGKIEYYYYQPSAWRAYAQDCVAGQYRLINPNVGIASAAGFTQMTNIVWELIPWSWAVDYFANFGEILSNFSGMFDNVEWNRCFHSTKLTGVATLPGETKSGQLNKQLSYTTRLRREEVIPLKYKFILDVTAGLRQASYLSSAIALTLKGKMS